jgi:hypothetical protein
MKIIYAHIFNLIFLNYLICCDLVVIIFSVVCCSSADILHSERVPFLCWAYFWHVGIVYILASCQRFRGWYRLRSRFSPGDRGSKIFYPLKRWQQVNSYTVPAPKIRVKTNNVLLWNFKTVMSFILYCYRKMLEIFYFTSEIIAAIVSLCTW